MFAVGNILLGLKSACIQIEFSVVLDQTLDFYSLTANLFCLPGVQCSNALPDLFIYFIFFREDQVNFRGFMRTLAHFRPIEDNEKNKNASASEPLNSRTNKLLCEFCSLRHLLAFQQIRWVSAS